MEFPDLAPPDWEEVERNDRQVVIGKVYGILSLVSKEVDLPWPLTWPTVQGELQKKLLVLSDPTVHQIRELMEG